MADLDDILLEHQEYHAVREREAVRLSWEKARDAARKLVFISDCVDEGLVDAKAAESVDIDELVMRLLLKKLSA